MKRFLTFILILICAVCAAQVGVHRRAFKKGRPAGPQIIDISDANWWIANATDTKAWLTTNFSNINTGAPTSTTGATVGAGYIGGVFTHTGKVVLIPNTTTTIKVYDPTTTSVTDGPVTTGGYWGGCLDQFGRVLMVPQAVKPLLIYYPEVNMWASGPVLPNGGACATVLPNGKVLIGGTSPILYDPITNTLASTTHGWGVMGAAPWTMRRGPNGKVYAFRVESICSYDYATNIATFVMNTTQDAGGSDFHGACIATNGTFIFANYNAPHTGIYDPAANTFTDGVGVTYGNAFNYLCPDGTIAFAPYYYNQVITYVPSTATQRNVTSTSGAYMYGMVLMPNGKMLMVPGGSSDGKISVFDPKAGTVATSTCLNPFINVGI